MLTLTLGGDVGYLTKSFENPNSVSSLISITSRLYFVNAWYQTIVLALVFVCLLCARFGRTLLMSRAMTTTMTTKTSYRAKTR